MLITIYNNEAKDSFQTTFKSNMILPKNCELKLTNAFIGLAHRITIPETQSERTYKISANEDGGTAYDVVISAGLYSLEALAKEIETKTKAVIALNKLSLDISVSYDNALGYDENALVFIIDAQTLNANKFISQPLNTGAYGTFTITENSNLIDQALDSAILNQTGNVNFVGMNSVKSTAGAEVDSWGYFNSFMDTTFHKWLLPSRRGNGHQPPSIPSSINPYGAVSIQDNSQTKNYWIGLTSGASNLAGVTTNAFTQITNIDNCPIVALVVKADEAGFTSGHVHIYENSAGAGLVEIGKTTGFVNGDKLGITIENLTEVVYWHRGHSGNRWKEIKISHGALRYQPSNGQALHFAFSVYGKNTPDSDAGASFKNWYASIADDATEQYGDFGQYIKWDWNGNGVKLGFTETADKYVADSTGGFELADLNFGNNVPVLVDGDNTLETYKTAPYLNLMVENLPINSYSDINTDTLENELDNSKCIASIPRYDQNGKFSIGYNLMYNPVEANVIKLHNEHEINISQLRFRLQQADGQIPQDLANPMSFVIDFNGEK